MARSLSVSMPNSPCLPASPVVPRMHHSQSAPNSPLDPEENSMDSQPDSMDIDDSQSDSVDSLDLKSGNIDLKLGSSIHADSNVELCMGTTTSQLSESAQAQLDCLSAAALAVSRQSATTTSTTTTAILDLSLPKPTLLARTPPDNTCRPSIQLEV